MNVATYSVTTWLNSIDSKIRTLLPNIFISMVKEKVFSKNRKLLLISFFYYNTQQIGEGSRHRNAMHSETKTPAKLPKESKGFLSEYEVLAV